MNIVIYIILALFVAFLFWKVPALIDDRVYVTAFDGNKYLVRNTKGRKGSADALARINKKLLDFISQLEATADSKHAGMVKRIRNRYRASSSLTEGKIDKRYTSYTINKGQQITFCLRTRDEYDQLYEDNLLTGVAIHELAHIASITTNHNDEFYRNFEYLLNKAVQFGIFTPITESVQYCGISTTIA